MTRHTSHVTTLHSGAPILRRYATTSALSLLMAMFRAVIPSLQRRREVNAYEQRARGLLAPVPHGEISSVVDQHMTGVKMTIASGQH